MIHCNEIFSFSSSMDNHKHVKVKSRWTQSCQMDMMTEESQSSLEMSDSITDVSTSDLNENTDNSSELTSLEVRRSRRTSSNRSSNRKFGAMKTTQQNDSITLNNPKKISINIKQPLNTTDNDKKENIHQKPNNIIDWTSVNWNNIAISQTRKKSKSVNNISRLLEKCPSKPIRRASLSWEFPFTSTDKRDNYYNLYNSNKHLNLSKSLVEIQSLSINYKQLCKEKICLLKKNMSNENISQKPYYLDVDTLNCKFDDEHNKLISSVSKIEISQTNSKKQEQFDELNEHVNHFDELKTRTYIEPFSTELGSLRYSRPISIPMCKEIRSKSLDFLMTRTKNSFKRCISCEDMKKLENSVVVTFKLQKTQQKSPKKIRRQSKRIKPKNKSMDMFDDIIVPEVDYNQVADKIYQEHKNQLLEARIKDKEFDQKLKSTNFTLVNENVYQPDK